MHILNTLETEQVSGGTFGTLLGATLIGVAIGYVGGEIIDGARQAFNNRTTHTSSGGQMNRLRRIRVTKKDD
jgi:hypothetical protein